MKSFIDPCFFSMSVPVLHLISICCCCCCYCGAYCWSLVCVCGSGSQGLMDPVGLASSSPLGLKEKWVRRHLRPGQLSSCKAWPATYSSQVRATHENIITSRQVMYGHTTLLDSLDNVIVFRFADDDDEFRECMLSLFIFAMQINQTEQAGLRHTFGKCRLIDHYFYFRYFKEVFWLN